MEVDPGDRPSGGAGDLIAKVEALRATLREARERELTPEERASLEELIAAIDALLGEPNDALLGGPNDDMGLTRSLCDMGLTRSLREFTSYIERLQASDLTPTDRAVLRWLLNHDLKAPRDMA